MIKVSGCNTHGQLVTDLNCKTIDGFPAVCPPQEMNIDTSRLLSISIYEDHTVCVLDDGKAVAYGNNAGNRIYNKLPDGTLKRTEFNIFDNDGKVCKLLSAVCGSCYTLYMAISIVSSQVPILVYISSKKNNGQPIFINIGKSCPIALYGGNTKCAAITDEGSVLILSNSALRTPEKEIQAVSLLNNEKAVLVACCDHVIYALSTVGHVYKSTSIDSFSSFKIISELCETEIIWISGTCRHCLAVSKEGRVYACGSNGYGEMALKNDNEEIENFVLIESLIGQRIVAAYAGYSHSLFQNIDGQIFACGNNGYDQMLLIEQTYINNYLPLETTITKDASFCIAGHALSVVFIDSQPPIKSPNQKIPNNIFSIATIEKVVNEENPMSAQLARMKKKNHKLKKKNRILQIRIDELEAQIYLLKEQIDVLAQINDQNAEKNKKEEERENEYLKKLESITESDNDDDSDDDNDDSNDDEYHELVILEPEDINLLKSTKKLGSGILSKSTKVSREEFFVLKEFKTISESNASLQANDNSDDELFESEKDIDIEKMKLMVNLYETLNKLNHPNIVKAVNFFNGDSKHHRHASLLLEFCPTTLKDTVKRLSKIERVGIIYEISSAMRSVHKIGIIHRDLKPENVLIDSSKHVKISDFGATILMPFDVQVRLSMAKQIHHSNDRQKLIAPELLCDNKNSSENLYDEKVDVYSFGVIVYYILMKGECPKGVGDEIFKDEKQQNFKCINEFSRNLIKKCCSLSSKDRPSFSEIVESIKENNFNLIDGIENHLQALKSHLSI